VRRIKDAREQFRAEMADELLSLFREAKISEKK
jgi:hypothetical protein